jgi:hypothetical protein
VVDDFDVVLESTAPPPGVHLMLAMFFFGLLVVVGETPPKVFGAVCIVCVGLLFTCPACAVKANSTAATVKVQQCFMAFFHLFNRIFAGCVAPGNCRVCGGGVDDPCAV